MADALDFVALYARAEGLTIRSRTILVEGSSDVALLELAAELERQRTGFRLIDEDFAVVAAGEGPRGGSQGVVRQLITLRSMGQKCLLPNGHQRYRFVALFDNDDPGRVAVNMAQNIDTSILEFKDVFRLRPVMPIPRSMDPRTVQKSFEEANVDHKALKWELEDLLDERLVETFLQTCPGVLRNRVTTNGRTHWELSRQGKQRLHQYAIANATFGDVVDLCNTLRALRSYVGLK